MRITLRQLRVFEAVARMKSVSRGADEACLSQSAASMALKELEEGLRITLFHRNGKQLAINENGRRIQPLVVSLLAMARDLEQISSEHHSWGTLRVSASTTIGYALLGEVCKRFCELHPSARIDLHVTHSGEVMQGVEAMAYDVGLIETPSNRKGLKVEPLCKDSLTVFAAPSHPFAGRERVTAEELLVQRWCLGDAGSVARNSLTLRLGESGLNIALTANTPEAIKSAVVSGLGLGCLSPLLIEKEVALGRIVTIDLDPSISMERNFYLITPLVVYKGRLIEAFADIAREFLGDEKRPELATAG